MEVRAGWTEHNNDRQTRRQSTDLHLCSLQTLTARIDQQDSRTLPPARASEALIQLVALRSFQQNQSMEDVGCDSPPKGVSGIAIYLLSRYLCKGSDARS